MCLKYSHCHHRNHLYNPHIQSHYPENSPQGVRLKFGSDSDDGNWISSSPTKVISDAICLFFLARSPRKTHARVSRAMAQFFLKIAHLSFSMGPTPLLKMVFSYGLRPRLRLLFKILQIFLSLAVREMLYSPI